jgi:hypothetical protein
VDTQSFNNQVLISKLNLKDLDPKLNYDILFNVVRDAKLTIYEFTTVHEFIQGKKDPFDFCDSSVYEKLFEYFTFETAEMPYGVAKARTGEPDIWILDYFVL